MKSHAKLIVEVPPTVMHTFMEKKKRSGCDTIVSAFTAMVTAWQPTKEPKEAK